jgi:hypothetical protein
MQRIWIQCSNPFASARPWDTVHPRGGSHGVAFKNQLPHSRLYRTSRAASTSLVDMTGALESSSTPLVSEKTCSSLSEVPWFGLGSCVSGWTGTSDKLLHVVSWRVSRATGFRGNRSASGADHRSAETPGSAAYQRWELNTHQTPSDAKRIRPVHQRTTAKRSAAPRLFAS